MLKYTSKCEDCGKMIPAVGIPYGATGNECRRATKELKPKHHLRKMKMFKMIAGTVSYDMGGHQK